jgi:hypothetical protein
MWSRVPALALAGSAALFSVSMALAQSGPPPGAPPPPPKNLQVFPKDIPRPQLIANMKLFSQSLGVRCTFCHVGEEGKLDFASDGKKEKLVARKMLAMVHRINKEDFGVTDFANVKVTCFTCHRGSTKPVAMPPADAPVPPPPAAKKPERGAV